MLTSGDADNNTNLVNYELNNSFDSENEDDESELHVDKIYTCQLCGRTFNKRNAYWYHVNKSKKLCVSKEQVLNELNIQKGKIKSYQEENERLKQVEEENQRLKKQLEFVQELTSKDTPKNVTYNIDIDLSNNLNINNINKCDIDNYMEIKLASNKKERLDHIPPELFLEILKCKNVPDSVTQIIRSVYFNPKAPENYTWCVIDMKAKNGTLRYNEETECVLYVDTIDTIKQNVQNVMPKVLDIITDINKTVPFSKLQEQNYHGLYGLYGTELELFTVNKIREMAYKRRDLPRVIWKDMNLKNH